MNEFIYYNLIHLSKQQIGQNQAITKQIPGQLYRSDVSLSIKPSMLNESKLKHKHQINFSTKKFKIKVMANITTY